MKRNSYIDPETCRRCGLCIAVCPNNIPHTVIEHSDAEAVAFRPDRVEFCIRCGHCMAICPTESIHIEGLTYKGHLFDVHTDDLDYDSFAGLLASRRSVRVFKDTPVPRKTLEKIVDAITMAPMGFTPHKVEVTIVQNRKTIERALPLMVEFYEKLGRWMSNPMIRLMMRRRLDAETFNTIRNHVVPIMAFRLPDIKAGKGDTITRGAPAMLLFHAHRESDAHTHDAFIALTYGLLAAHAMGLGATAISLLPPAIEKTPELRVMFQIPQENEVVASMVVGYPQYHFKRGIRREMAGVNWI